jgi:hypothetical protein
VSEYQYYEFLAIDRPLDAAEQAQVRSLSSRARISATSFVNEYHWGDFRGDPNRLVERYYAAHLYVANWGTHRLMLRLPGELLDLDVVEDYCVREQVNARMDLLRRFRDDTAPSTLPGRARRRVADLLDDTARRRTERAERLAVQRAEDEARREQARALARERRLDDLAGAEDTAWSRVDALIASRKPVEYAAAVTLLTDLQALAERDGRHHTFTARTTALRHTHARKPSLLERLDQAGI